MLSSEREKLETALFDIGLNIGYEAKFDEPMSAHTSFRIGGPADIFIAPSDWWQLMDVLDMLTAYEIPVTVLGGGTNVLVSDAGIRGAVVSTSQMRGARASDCLIMAGAGERLSAVANFAQQNGLGGLEFAAGIPGTVGGAICMNAGAYGGQMADVVQSVYVAQAEGGGSHDRTGKWLTTDEAAVWSDTYSETYLRLPHHWMRKWFAADEMGFGYRTSIVDASMVVTEVTFALHPADPAQIRAKMDELLSKRNASQPTNLPSAGSVFKRPPGHFAGKLIEDANLKGCSVGDARVSEKHAGFIVNTGRATCADVLELIDTIQRRVYETSGIKLEPEIKFLG